jgi:hypothetical protein
MRVVDVLIDLGLLPIKDIPQLPKTAQEVLPAVALTLKCLQGALDSSAGPWDWAPLPSLFLSLSSEDGYKKYMLIYI